MPALQLLAHATPATYFGRSGIEKTSPAVDAGTPMPEAAVD